MAKARTLRGLAHDVVDHAESAFGALHPHAAQYARNAQVNTVAIDLLSSPAIAGDSVPSELATAAQTLQLWFVSALERYGFSTSDLERAELTLGDFGDDDYTCGAAAVIESRDGKSYEYLRGWKPGTAPQLRRLNSPGT